MLFNTFPNNFLFVYTFSPVKTKKFRNNVVQYNDKDLREQTLDTIYPSMTMTNKLTNNFWIGINQEIGQSQIQDQGQEAGSHELNKARDHTCLFLIKDKHVICKKGKDNGNRIC